MFGFGSKFLELGQPSSKEMDGVSSVFTDMVDPLLDDGNEENIPGTSSVLEHFFFCFSSQHFEKPAKPTFHYFIINYNTQINDIFTV